MKGPRLTRSDGIAARLDRQDAEIERLRNTLKGVTRAVGDLSVSSRCENCDRCYALVEDGRIYCPNCKAGRTL